MATRQKRVSQREIKRETETTDGAAGAYNDDQASEDLDKAEARLEERKRLQKESPNKSKKAQRRESSSDDDEENSEDEKSHDSEMDDFIVDDEEVEADFDPKDKKHKKKRRAPEIKPLDEEDLEVIRENVGIDLKKKSRLKRTAALENSPVTKDAVKKEDITMIDTMPPKSHSLKIKANEDDLQPVVKRNQSTEEVRQKSNADTENRRKAQDIFGEQKDRVPAKSDTKTDVSVSRKEFFNSDEIDDPFNTEADLKIAETDIPERLQIKLDGRLLQKSPEATLELQSEAQWILDRITSTCDNQKQLLQAKDASEKIFKVLSMIRVDFYDIPMICKYRKYEYEPELTEDSVWLVYAFDLEYGKFQRAKTQVSDFLYKIQKCESKVKSYLDELTYAKTLSDLSNFNALIRFLRHKYDDSLLEKNLVRKQPQRKDEIQVARQNRIPDFIKYCFLESGQYQENLMSKKLAHEPPEPKVSPLSFSADYVNEIYLKPLDLLQAVCFYAAVELSSQPYIRNMVKQTIRLSGEITCNLTEQGKKELDVFHHSYRLKLVQDRPLEKMRNSDLYLDIQQCERVGLLQSTISLRKSKIEDLKKFFQETYMVDHSNLTQWNKMRVEVIKILIEDLLIKEITKEVKEEIQLEAETYVINKCKRQYANLLMTGPFHQQRFNQPQQQESSRLKRQEDIIKPKNRLCVMSAFMHQIDANNYIVTIAIVDKNGELQFYKDFMRLLPPRKKRVPNDRQGQQQDVVMQENQHQAETEEEKDHKRDKEILIAELRRHSVDLVVVAANSLESRRLFDQMKDLTGEAKSSENFNKEADLIWGRTEVPKLFSLSHNSQRLHKNVPQILKQAVCLARFEQDPLTEVLNLWSPITAENQALALSLDPMQKLVNQAKLAEGLEEENIRAVNNVGVDLNLVFQHEHMQSCLQFLSGLGPRMAKRAMIKFKQLNKKLSTRGEMLKNQLFSFKVYFSVVPFVLIRIPDDAFQNSSHVQKFDILDQTRIHHEHYKLAMKIATDAFHISENQDQKEVDKTEQNRHCKEVIAHPKLLESLDQKAYDQQLDMTGQGNMKIVIKHIIEEFQCPFKDPRDKDHLRNISKTIDDKELFYLLIDETERTFKKGQIVTGTVTKVIGDIKVICRLENGLNAVIGKNNLMTLSDGKKLENDIQPGYIVTGRIEKINTGEGVKKFEVDLNCKQVDLQSHKKYINELAESHGIDPKFISEEDQRNLNFNIDPNNKNQGRFVPRRIAHEKFKNISSKRAQAELAEAEVGDFVFRPSTRSEDHITLTWKFWAKQFVHIDIQEFEKPKGASIGSRLTISSESFENLREIVERYIIPCNRLVREVVRSPKWVDTDRFEVVEETLKAEKNADRSRIPYRFVILSQYQQHVVLAYLPKEKVVKEFIKVRPKGFYFHEQNLSPFMNLVNWFKENWQTKDYQRHLKRQKSPRPSVKVIPQIKETPGEQEDGANWQGAGGGSVHSYNGGQQYGNVKTEQQKSYGRGQRGDRQASPGNQWGDNRAFKQENQGGRSPGRWTGRDNLGQQNDAVMADSYDQTDRGGFDRPQRSAPGGKGCHKCGQEGHFARDCQNGGGENNNRSRDCFICKQPGHIARDCQNKPADHEERSGYKRQRRDDNNQGSYRGQNEGWVQGQSNQAGQDASRQTEGWQQNQGASSGWN